MMIKTRSVINLLEGGAISNLDRWFLRKALDLGEDFKKANDSLNFQNIKTNGCARMLRKISCLFSTLIMMIPKIVRWKRNNTGFDFSFRNSNHLLYKNLANKKTSNSQPSFFGWIHQKTTIMRIFGHTRLK